MGTGSPVRGDGHRILIENSEYWLRNYGDLAMLEVTVRRVRRRWPDARIGIMTESPALVAAYFPDTVGITVGGRDPWGRCGPVRRVAAALGPTVVGPPVLAWLRTRAWLLPRAIRLRDMARGLVSSSKAVAEVNNSTDESVSDFERRHPGAALAARTAALVVALGGGYLTDSDIPQAGRAFGLLEYAAGAGVPTALVGQGIGPLRDADLRGRASRALTKAGVIGLRERRRGPALLDSLGVAPEIVAVTGDDAIELAQEARKDLCGTAIGVCLRIARYAPVARVAQDRVGAAVRAAASEFGTHLIPLIIAETPGSPDRRTTVPLVRGSANAAAPLGRFVRPAEVAAQVADCRILVTGAYHLAVFALTQGIPVVGLTSTEYYDDKFLGLAEMFGGGVDLVHLDDAELAERLSAAIRTAWSRADTIRAELRASADDQVESGRRAYERVFTLLESAPADHGR
ncbi:polysaccharide pyruvyl transferase family protein [Nocardia panacis]|uniref:Polysaccharide pyruvyl transferase family protein n=1 Tax=Nocardia panacis TaxID=2340916 RepID=A0A3A4KHN5_9NOCA|nr:polysaccharide pyruvyl transferase family protein [Nocardia panacis]RJO75598.1 polysaccharide pyruvyl transferase family protein [Nocardia panacis]